MQKPHSLLVAEIVVEQQFECPRARIAETYPAGADLIIDRTQVAKLFAAAGASDFITFMGEALKPVVAVFRQS